MMCIGYLCGKNLACGKMRINVFTYMDEDMKFKIIKTVLALFLILSVTACSKDVPETLNKKAFEIISIDETSFPGRDRVNITILSKEAKTRDEFAKTAMGLAYDYAHENNYDVVTVLLEPSRTLSGNGNAYAIANYAIDGGGYSGDQGWRWKVCAAEKKIDELAVAMGDYYYAIRDNFQTEDGLTDGDKVINQISIKFNMNKDTVKEGLARAMSPFCKEYPLN